MRDPRLRHAIAAEAARLIYQRKESDYFSARRKAARWLSRQRVPPEELPTHAEIQNEVFALAGLFTAERQTSALAEMRYAALELMKLLHEFHPRISGSALSGPIMAGAEITLHLTTERTRVVFETLEQAGLQPRAIADVSATDFTPEISADSKTIVRIFHHFPCELNISEAEPPRNAVDLQELERLMGEKAGTKPPIEDLIADEEEFDEQAYHPDAFPMMRMLLESLQQIKFDSRRHPEGDALYHSLQVFELGLAERPYDEEFLLACLLHDAGLGIDRRNPLAALHQALGGLITPRTWLLIEHLQDGIDYLATGKMRGSLKRSEHFDDLVLLAQCDLNGRVCGTTVSSAEEALDYIASLSTAWD